MPAPEPVVEKVYRKLGGRQVLGEEVNSDADLARLVRRRIPLRALASLKRGGFSDRENLPIHNSRAHAAASEGQERTSPLRNRIALCG